MSLSRGEKAFLIAGIGLSLIFLGKKYNDLKDFERRAHFKDKGGFKSEISYELNNNSIVKMEYKVKPTGTEELNLTTYKIDNQESKMISFVSMEDSNHDNILDYLYLSNNSGTIVISRRFNGSLEFNQIKSIEEAKKVVNYHSNRFKELKEEYKLEQMIENYNPEIKIIY